MDGIAIALKNGQVMDIREASPEDAGALIAYVEEVCGESDNLTFGPGEFGMTLAEEEAFLRGAAAAAGQVYFLGLVGGRIVAALNFAAGKRPRTRHAGEFGLSVRKEYWGLGAGGAMIDMLIKWAMETSVIHKIDLHVRVDNDRAIALYRKKGFALEGTLRAEISIDGRFFDLHAMGLMLDGGPEFEESEQSLRK